MTDPVADIIGEYRGFAAHQRDRLRARGIDIAPYTLSPLAYRVPKFEGPNSTPDPVYILMEDFTHVKFYRLSLEASVELFGDQFDGFHHVEDWVPQQLVTATGPNPLPR